MKEKYNGLKTERITVRSASLLDASRANVKAKTRSTNWQEETIGKEFDMTDINLSSPAIGNRQDYWSTEY